MRNDLAFETMFRAMVLRTGQSIGNCGLRNYFGDEVDLVFSDHEVTIVPDMSFAAVAVNFPFPNGSFLEVAMILAHARESLYPNTPEPADALQETVKWERLLFFDEKGEAISGIFDKPLLPAHDWGALELEWMLLKVELTVLLPNKERAVLYPTFELIREMYFEKEWEGVPPASADEYAGLKLLGEEKGFL